MAERLVNIDRETPMLFPIDMREWLPENHLVHFIIDAIGHIDISTFKINKRGSGDEQFPPAMMLAMLSYSYIPGRFGSRTIEASTYTDVAMRYICADKVHPDHSVICSFRKDNKEAFEESFTKILLLGRQLGVLKRVGGVSEDGTKVKANASKHKAVSYKRAGEIIEELKTEVAELVKTAEKADEKELEKGYTIPEEIKLRKNRQLALEEARKEMERLYKEAETEGTNKGKKLDEYQHNFTDSDSRIMKAGGGKHFEQSYNAQAAVDTEGSMLILGGYVTQDANDKKELKKLTDSVPEEVRQVSDVSADSGYYSEEAVDAIEQVKSEGKKKGPEVYCAVGKGKHGKTVDDLKKKTSMGRSPANMTKKEKMARKLKTKKGKATYKKRKETVEPVFGIIKSVMGFRQFMLRGIEKVNTEWTLVRVAYNLKRLHRLLEGESLLDCLAYG
jgi:transposase